MHRHVARISRATLSIFSILLIWTAAVDAKTPPARTVPTPKHSAGKRVSSAQPIRKTSKPRAEADSPSFQPDRLISPGLTQRVEVDLEVGGHLLVDDQGDAHKVPMSVVAQLHYDERFLEASAAADKARRAIRYYEKAEAVIKIDKSVFKPRLDDALRLVAAEAMGDRVTLFSLDGPLTREQLDLIDIPATSLMIDALLPSGEVGVGQSWSPADWKLAALLRLDAVGQCDVKCLLASLAEGQARVVMGGAVHGALEGTASEMDVKAVCVYGLNPLRIVSLDLVIQEKRSVGHAGPGLDATARLKLRYSPVDGSSALDADPVSADSLQPSAESLWLVHEPPAGNYRVMHDRRWYVTLDESRISALRLIDHGELIAQCQISPLASVSAERMTDLQQFQKEVRYSLGKRFRQFEQARSWEDSLGRSFQRVVVGGDVDGLPIEWRYYLVSGSDGQRMALSFTVEKDLADRLGDADRMLVDSVQWLKAEPSGNP
jgi:hypothetical protein